MADQKISQLPTITGANMATNDKFVLVDTSGDATVATTRSEFFKSTPNISVNGTVTLNSSTASLILNETDATDKNTQILGAGGTFRIRTRSDDGGTNKQRLRIDHGTGDISFYEDTGTTAKLFWDSSAESLGLGTSSPSSALHVINSNATGESIATFEALSAKNGYVYINADANRRKSLVFQSAGVDKFSMGVGDSDELSESSFFIGTGKTGGNGAKLVIDSSGNLDVTGTGLFSTGLDTPLRVNSTDSSSKLAISDNVGSIGLRNYRGSLDILVDGDASSSSNQRQSASFADNGDVSFYEDTGNTPKFHWDASAERLGIGTSSPSVTLNTVSDTVWFQNAARTYGIGIYADDSNSATKIRQINSGGSIKLATGSGGANEVIMDSSGKVGIGTDSPSRQLEVQSSTGGNAYLSAKRNNATSTELVIGAESGNTVISSEGAIPMAFYTNSSERMRISSAGNVSIGKTGVLISAVGIYFTPEGTIGATKDGAVPLVLNRVATGTNNPNGVIAQFRRETVTVGNISVSDGATAYNTSSDYRLKENVVELTSASERVNQLKPSRFNWISDDTNTVIDGFIAHEVATVVPEAITGAKDAMIDEEYEVTPEVLDEDGNVTTEAVMGTRSVPDYQGIDQSKLVPLLTAALQEALTEISSLKSRVEALEG